MGIRQRIIYRARTLSKKAKYKVKYTYSQVVRTTKKKTTTKYSYKKKIVAKRKKYSYNYRRA